MKMPDYGVRKTHNNTRQIRKQLLEKQKSGVLFLVENNPTAGDCFVEQAQLRSEGHECSGSHAEPRAIKTRAPLSAVEAAVWSAATRKVRAAPRFHPCAVC